MKIVTKVSFVKVKEYEANFQKVRNTCKWKDILYSCMGRMNIVKVFIQPKDICRFNTIFIKIQMAFFRNIGKIILKFVNWYFLF